MINAIIKNILLMNIISIPAPIWLQYYIINLSRKSIGSQMSKIISLLFIGILLSACAGMPANTPANSPTSMPEPAATPTKSSSSACSSPSSWTIRFNLTGGFAGFNETLMLDNGGNLTVQSERPPVDVQKVVSEDQVAAFTKLLSQACPFDVIPDKGTCADCFVYDLEIQMDGQTYSVQASDVTLSGELQPLIGALSQLLQETGQ